MTLLFGGILHPIGYNATFSWCFNAFNMVSDDDNVLRLMSKSIIKACSLDLLTSNIMQKCCTTCQIDKFCKITNWVKLKNK